MKKMFVINQIQIKPCSKNFIQINHFYNREEEENNCN